MPDYDTPREAATAAYDALRYLAHTVRETPTRELYDLNREMLGIARLLPDVFRKMAALTLARADEATIQDGDTLRPGTPIIETAARDLVRAADFVDRAETRLDRTSQHLGLLMWHPPQRSEAQSAHLAARPIGTLGLTGLAEAARQSTAPPSGMTR